MYVNLGKVIARFPESKVGMLLAIPRYIGRLVRETSEIAYGSVAGTFVQIGEDRTDRNTKSCLRYIVRMLVSDK